MTQRVKAPAALAEDPSFVPSSCETPDVGGTTNSSGFVVTASTWCKYTYTN